MIKKNLAKQLAHGINLTSVGNAVFWLVLGIVGGAVAMLYQQGNPTLARWLLEELKEDGLLVAFLLFLLMRLSAVARWPRATPLDYNKITGAGVVAANFVSIVIGAMLIIGTLAWVAPGVLELLAKHFGDK